MTHSTVPERRTRFDARRALAPLLLAAAAQIGCLGSTPIAGPANQPLGALQLTSEVLGRHTLEPVTCLSGERQLFLGADFPDATSGLTARLIIDPNGAASVRVFRSAVPLEPGLLLDRRDCTLFEVSLERSGWSINDIYDLRVSLSVACHGSSGDSLEGALSASSCH